MGKFNKGVFVGGLVGAAFMWLNTTKKGRDTRTQLIAAAADIYGNIKDGVLTSAQWKKMTKSKYAKLVMSSVDTYAKKYSLPASAKNMLERLLLSQWTRLQKEGKKYFS